MDTHTVDRTEEFATHMFRERNRMTDTWANRRADGRAESCVTKREWGVKGTKAITGYWDGNAKDEGSGCGFVIKVTDREEVLLAARKIALPFV